MRKQNNRHKRKFTAGPLNQGLKIIKERTSRTSLTIVLAIFVFVILLSAIGLATLTLVILETAGVLADAYGQLNLGTVILVMTVVSLVLGGVIAFFSSRLPLKPINNLINKINRLAAGDFKARLEFGPMLASHPVFKEISSSFNKMAEELDNTELLRNDFINYFSHEFKTPIVSIMGFAKLLSKGNLTEEQKAFYLKSIEEESMRLSTMANNVLELSKVENQTILTDVTPFNVSEQIRWVVLLLEMKWVEKNIELQIDLDEVSIEANEELLKQVWINLVDNAVKFTPRCGTVSFEIVDEGEKVCVKISNTGIEIPSEVMDKIFHKFYQADESHATQGNGVGLAIVKKVVTLHGGEVTVSSQGGVTTFAVTLPKTQSVFEGA